MNREKFIGQISLAITLCLFAGIIYVADLCSSWWDKLHRPPDTTTFIYQQPVPQEKPRTVYVDLQRAVNFYRRDHEKAIPSSWKVLTDEHYVVPSYGDTSGLRIDEDGDVVEIAQK